MVLVEKSQHESHDTLHNCIFPKLYIASSWMLGTRADLDQQHDPVETYLSTIFVLHSN